MTIGRYPLLGAEGEVVLRMDLAFDGGSGMVEGSQTIQCIGAVGDGFDGIARACQCSRQQTHDMGLVFCDQYAFHVISPV